MAKTKVFGLEIPKRILGFKLSKGSRKDVRKLLKGLETPEACALAVSAVGLLVAFVAEKAAEREGPVGKKAGTVASAARPN